MFTFYENNNWDKAAECSKMPLSAVVVDYLTWLFDCTFKGYIQLFTFLKKMTDVRLVFGFFLEKSACLHFVKTYHQLFVYNLDPLC